METKELWENMSEDELESVDKIGGRTETSFQINEVDLS